MMSKLYMPDQINTSHSNKTHLIYIIIIAILVAISGVLYNSYITSESELATTQQMYSSASKQTKFYKDALGRSVAQSEVIQSLKTEDFVKAVFSDPAMKKLQKSVEANASKLKNGGSVTNIYNQGTIDNGTDTEVTEENGSPVYSSKFKDKWIDYSIKASKDTINLKMTYLDEFEVVIGQEKDKELKFFPRLFSKPIDYATVTSSSPYSQLKETKTYKVKSPTSSPWSVGLIGGYGYSSRGERDLFLGVGVSMRLFSLGSKK